MRSKPEGIIFHDLRRTVKTNMLSAGVDKVYRDTILGHSLQGMDVHYMAPLKTISTAPWPNTLTGWTAKLQMLVILLTIAQKRRWAFN